MEEVIVSLFLVVCFCVLFFPRHISHRIYNHRSLGIGWVSDDSDFISRKIFNSTEDVVVGSIDWERDNNWEWGWNDISDDNYFDG